MTRRASSVAGYLESASGPIGRRGGRGVVGDLTRWLIAEQDAIDRGRAAGRLPWAVVAQLAAAENVVNAEGQPYDRRVMSNAWARLVRRNGMRATARGVPSFGPEAERRPDYPMPSDRASPSSGPMFPSRLGLETEATFAGIIAEARDQGTQRGDGRPDQPKGEEGRTARAAIGPNTMVAQGGGVLGPMRKRRAERVLPENLEFDVFNLNQAAVQDIASGHTSGAHDDETPR